MDHFLDLARSDLLFRHSLWLTRASWFEWANNVSLVHQLHLIYTNHACHRGQTFHRIGLLELASRYHQYCLLTLLLFECYWRKYGPGLTTIPTWSSRSILLDALKWQSVDSSASRTLIRTTTWPHFHASLENILPYTDRRSNVPSAEKPELRILRLWRCIQT